MIYFSKEREEYSSLQGTELAVLGHAVRLPPTVPSGSFEQAVDTYNTTSHYRSSQRCAAIFPVGGMKHSQDDPRRSLRPPDGGRNDLLAEVMRMLRLLSSQAKSKRVGWNLLSSVVG